MCSPLVSLFDLIQSHVSHPGAGRSFLLGNEAAAFAVPFVLLSDGTQHVLPHPHASSHKGKKSGYVDESVASSKVGQLLLVNA